jgi:hypothetical protein
MVFGYIFLINQQDLDTGGGHIMLKIMKYEGEIVTVGCTCGETTPHDISQIDSLEYIEEFDSYENITLQCPHCDNIHILNMNIPEDEYSEVEIEETLMPLYDINNRKVLRDVMWAKRIDLKGKNRVDFNKSRKPLLDEWNSFKKLTREQT